MILKSMSVDPHYFNYPGISPYVYVANNPLIFIDPDGRDVVFHSSDYDEQTGITSITSIRNTSITDSDGNVTGTVLTKTVTEVRKTGEGTSEVIGTHQTVSEFRRSKDGANELHSVSNESFTPDQLSQIEGLSGHISHVNTARDFVGQEGFGAVFPGSQSSINLGTGLTAAGFAIDVVRYGLKIGPSAPVIGGAALGIELLNRQHQNSPAANRRHLGREYLNR